jgi:diguanylate cyclase (GGDEF)-like protein
VNILLVESNRKLAEELRQSLQRGIAHAQTVTVDRGDDASAMLGLADLDCIVVGLNGASELEQVKNLTEGAGLSRTVPVVAVGDEPATLAGLAALRRGADEYVERASASGDALASKVALALERQRMRTAQLPIRDAITGLPNSVLFKDRVRSALIRSRRTASDVVVIFIDLDCFKDVNDTHGHAAGDLLLIEVARRLERSFRRSDTVARYGGDEFTVLCEGTEIGRHLDLLRAQVDKAFADPVPINSHEIAIEASVGIAVARDESNPEVLIKRADAAMYAAKRARGHR